MREETKFICDYCGKEYPTSEECLECESFHQIPDNIVEYTFQKERTKYPKYITVESINGMYAQYQFVKPIVDVEYPEVQF